MDMKELTINYIKANYHCTHCSFSKKKISILKKNGKVGDDFIITRIPLNQVGKYSFKVIYSIPVGTSLRIRLIIGKETVLSREFPEGELQVAQLDLRSGPSILRMSYELITKERLNYSIHKIKYGMNASDIDHDQQPIGNPSGAGASRSDLETKHDGTLVSLDPISVEQICKIDLDSLESRLISLVQALYVSENSFETLVEDPLTLSYIMMYLTSNEPLRNLILQQLVEYTLKNPNTFVDEKTKVDQDETMTETQTEDQLNSCGAESLVPLKTIQEHLIELHNSWEIIQRERNAINMEDSTIIKNNLANLMDRKREYQDDLSLLTELQGRFREEYLKITHLIQRIQQRQGTLDQITSDLNLRMIVQTQEQIQKNALLRQGLGIQEEIIHHQTLIQEQVPIYVKERFKFLLAKYVH